MPQKLILIYIYSLNCRSIMFDVIFFNLCHLFPSIKIPQGYLANQKLYNFGVLAVYMTFNKASDIFIKI